MFSLRTPVKPTQFKYILLNQGFGENDLDYKSLGLLGHNGIDFNSTARWQFGEGPVFAAHDGYVISDSTKQSDTAGRFVKLMTDEIELNGIPCKIVTLYFHLKVARVSVTDDLGSLWFEEGHKMGKERFVKAGTLIGMSDNTGSFTTGPHLHFGMNILWKKSDGTFQANTSNGYDGAVDPMPYLLDENVYVISQGWFTPAHYFYKGMRITRRETKPLLAKVIV